MMAKRATTLAQPYKFLDYYRFEDCDIFFGRELETEILLSDIVATRLVVLFAKTGTGKTSLINAGVRPRLEELDYATFYIRVEKDPTESARKDLQKALEEKKQLPSGWERQSLATQLEHAVIQLDKPIVVFFDQFEEFFIYIFNEDPEKARQFISDIAKVYRNRESGVHIVFSMREEFFVEMGAFRDEIPSIFHNDSNLRLQWFDKDQARAAIVGPARKFKTETQEDLVERLIRDLAEGGRIEPARLQIVCDTLWRQRTDGRILLADYERLGGAKRILDRRLEEDIDENLDTGLLQLFEKLLPKLSTKPGTKYVRGFGELVETLDTDADSLGKLIDQLKKIRLIRESTQYGALYIEWTSDYIAERSGDLQERVKAISLRRLLKAAMGRAELKTAELAKKGGPTDTPWIQALTEDDLEALYMTQSDYEAISDGADLLKDLSQAEAEFLFVAALEHGTYMSLWFRKASQSGVRVWQILQDRIKYGEAQSMQVKNVIDLLGELGKLRDEQAVELLEVALLQPTLGSITLEVLGEIRTGEAIALLERALQQDALTSQAIDVLRRMGTTEAINLLGMTLRQESAFALQAGIALNRVASSRPSRASSQASELLADVLTERAEPLFLQALEQGLDMRFWFEKASENGVRVWEILRKKIVSRDVPIELAENAVRLLIALGTGQAEDESRRALKLLETALQQDTLAGLTVAILSRMETKEAVELWESLLQQEHLAPQAQRALEGISESRTAGDGVKDKARSVLDKWRQDQGIAEPLRAPMVKHERLPAVSKALEDRDWDSLLRRIKDGNCTPFLGAGACAGFIPLGFDVAQEWARDYGYPLSDPWDLARVAQFLAVKRDPMFPRDEIVARFQTVVPPDFSAPGEPHGILADLPLPIYITTNYDDFMVRALRSRHRNPSRELCRWNSLVKDRPSVFDPGSGIEVSAANPVVFHLHGHTEVPESLVLTEDDYLDFLVCISRDPQIIPTRIVKALASTSLLFIGYRLADWDFRVLFRGLIGSLERSLGRIRVAVMLPPYPSETADITQEQVQQYLEDYLAHDDVRVYWGRVSDFAQELQRRWEAFNEGN